MTTPIITSSVKIDLSGGTGGASSQSVYTAPNGVVATSTASTYSNGNLYYMAYMFNGTYTASSTDYWLTNSNGNQTLTFDFTSGGIASGKEINQISVYPYTRSDASSNYSIDTSPDGTTWTEIVPLVTNSTSTPVGTERAHSNLSITGGYVRFNLTQNGSWGVTLNEIEFFEDTASGGASGGGNDDSVEIYGFTPVYAQDFGGVEGAAASSGPGTVDLTMSTLSYSTLANGDRLATGTAVYNNSSTTTTTAEITDDFYVEIVIAPDGTWNGNNNYIMIGASTNPASYGYGNSGANGYFMYTMYNNAVYSGNSGTWLPSGTSIGKTAVAGDVVQIGWNATTRRLYYGMNGQNSPATNIYYETIAGTGGIYLGFGSGTSGNTGGIELGFVDPANHQYRSSFETNTGDTFANNGVVP